MSPRPLSDTHCNCPLKQRPLHKGTLISSAVYTKVHTCTPSHMRAPLALLSLGLPNNSYRNEVKGAWVQNGIVFENKLMRSTLSYSDESNREIFPIIALIWMHALFKSLLVHVCAGSGPHMCEGHCVRSQHIPSVGVYVCVFEDVKSLCVHHCRQRSMCRSIKIQCRGIASSSDVCTHACRCRLN